MDSTVGSIRGITELTRDRPWRRVLQLVPEGLAILACVAVIWGAVAFTLWQASDAAVVAARNQSATLARAFAESSERISTVLDRDLLALRARFAEKGDAFDLTDWVRTQSSPDHMIIQTSIANSAGLITQASVPLNNKQITIADRGHFRAQLDPGQDRLYISKPLIGRLKKLCSVQFTRKLLDGAGEFAGVAINSVSCEDLSRFYDTANIDDGFVILSGLDGFIRAYGPVRPELLGTNLNDDAELAPIFSSREGTLIARVPWDAAPRVISFRRLDQYPLVVMVGYDDARVYRQYQPIRNRAIEIGGTATLIIIILGLVWIQQRIRSAASRQALLLTLANMDQGIIMIDTDGRIPVINRRATELLGLPRSLLEPRRKMSRAEASDLGMLIGVEEVEAGKTEYGTVHRDGRIIESVNHRLLGGGLVRTFTDVTERRIADARVRHMAHHDSLTGLANRVLLGERLAEQLRQANVGGFGLLCLDLDGFKTVNDTLGHEAGDRLLREVSRRLQRVVGNTALLARTGGDEFAILSPGGAGTEAGEALAKAVAAAMSAAIDLDGTQFRLSASLGLAFHPTHGTTAVELIRHADTAMYHAKALGRGRIVRFDPEMERIQHERSLIERDLRRALKDRELEVWFQPRFETRTLRISGFEALARWRHPERGFISPVQFIPVAEQCGLIAELGIQVLEDACAFAASLPDGRIAVNLSPVQFLSDNLPDVISGVLEAHGLTSDRLELEVTEGVLIADEVQALTTLQSLHDKGLHLALDDFGTGFASLSYLRRFPFDRIKIDRSFVQAQEHNSATRAIVESVLTMASRLQLEVTAEGVETESQLSLLLTQGCPEVQGFFLGMPMTADDARAFRANHDATSATCVLAAD
jgi:diguanylate cyclase (GGDEF)-like protein